MENSIFLGDSFDDASEIDEEGEEDDSRGYEELPTTIDHVFLPKFKENIDVTSDDPIIQFSIGHLK